MDPTLTNNQKISFCINGIKRLTRQERITVAKILSLRGYADRIKEVANGCVFNMDMLLTAVDEKPDETTINEIYNFIKHKSITPSPQCSNIVATNAS